MIGSAWKIGRDSTGRTPAPEPTSTGLMAAACLRRTRLAGEPSRPGERANRRPGPGPWGGAAFSGPRACGDEVVAASFEGRPADPPELDPRDLALHIARVLGELAAADRRES